MLLEGECCVWCSSIVVVVELVQYMQGDFCHYRKTTGRSFPFFWGGGSGVSFCCLLMYIDWRLYIFCFLFAVSYLLSPYAQYPLISPILQIPAHVCSLIYGILPLSSPISHSNPPLPSISQWVVSPFVPMAPMGQLLPLLLAGT